MLKRLDQLADRSCWISGERINCCVGVDGHGIIEVGFHGAQPVSRNSRMLVRDEGVLSFSVRDESGREERVPFDSVDWQPQNVAVSFSPWGRAMQLQVLATARTLLITMTGDVKGCTLVAEFSLASCTTQVRGERRWEPHRISGRWLILESHDSIRLHDWIRQEGPYAGDFLIPEPWRRVLFSRRIRSGQATVADLRPEYRDADVLLYDARTVLRIGGEHCVVERQADRIVFCQPLEIAGVPHPVLVIEGGERPDSFAGDEPAILCRPEPMEREIESRMRLAPRFTCDAAPETAAWFATVPATVQSCTVSDIGMPRATPGAYYWLWAWDSLVTGMEIMRWGAYGLAADIVRFITTHRDSDGAIPGRWTRSGQPLDTPPRGALEFLLLHLAYQHAVETGQREALLDAYPHAVSHVQAVVHQSHGSGMVPNPGFYPDLLQRFGRTERSVVAMETGCLYGFARILDNAAAWMGDTHTGVVARNLAHHIEGEFLKTFWDSARGFLADAVDAETGERNTTYPLFSLLFLQSPLGLALIRHALPDMARFMKAHLQTEHGIRLLPSWDLRRGSEDVAASWYPHWDLYLLKVLRRAGDRDAILRWLRAVEQALRHLGYTPEFLKLDGFSADDPAFWRQHGAVSNLNCVTAWYHGVLEGLLGIDADPGGMSVIPLDLPLGPLQVQGVTYQRTRWNIRVQPGGPMVEELLIDGRHLRGTLKVPAACQDGGEHELSVRYGQSMSGPCFREILNAEVLESEGDTRSCTVRIRALGATDIIVDQAHRVRCEVDGRPLDMVVDADTGIGAGRIVENGTHVLALRTVV